MIRIDTKEFESLCSYSGPPGNKRINMETTTIEWALCSPHFEDIVIIAPWNLNNILIILQYEEISTKQIHRRYFEAEHYKTQQMKGRRPKRSVETLKDYKSKLLNK